MKQFFDIVDAHPIASVATVAVSMFLLFIAYMVRTSPLVNDDDFK